MQKLSEKYVRFTPRKYSVRPFQVLMESLIPYLTGNVHCACGDLMSNVDMPDEADGTAAAAYAQSIDRRGLKLKLGIADLLGLLSKQPCDAPAIIQG